jgi:hypothetical protein
MTDIKNQKQRVEQEIKKLEAMGGSFGGRVKHIRDSAFTRFPFLFVFLSTFGVVATLYGFEKLIDQIDYFQEHPGMVLVAGVITLLVTGSLYKKLT